MQFIVSPIGSKAATYLIPDNWNDWFTWLTQFTAVVVDEWGNKTNLGSVKIARQGMSANSSTTSNLLPPEFKELDESFFSLGQTENYYETLTEIGDDFREEYLKAIRDCAFDTAILDLNLSEQAMSNSLLRSVRYDRVRQRFHRLAHGDAALTSYSFEYTLTSGPEQTGDPVSLQFDVRPGVLPPTNVHVLIGRNGVGKSRCFDHMTRALLCLQSEGQQDVGEFHVLSSDTSSWDIDAQPTFSSLVTVAFSAFDNSRPYSALEVKGAPLRYAYVGLKKEPELNTQQGLPSSWEEFGFPLKTHNELAREFVDSVAKCRAGARRRRWRQALKTLETDPLFQDANVSSLAEIAENRWKSSAYRLFRKLSSGHGIVLLTITRLVELVEERSLVLLDEPEGHLHPPLLSAFVRALSDLLTQRNGVAIAATHSPVVLQEVPSSCVWILNRSGQCTRVDRPEIETFGENVGVLTREVFGLEVTQSGFHRMISEAAAELRDYEKVVERFDGRLGAEGRGLARTLTLLAKRQPNLDSDSE